MIWAAGWQVFVPPAGFPAEKHPVASRAYRKFAGLAEEIARRLGSGAEAGPNLPARAR